MTPEHKLGNEIRLWCGEHNWLCYHINSGKVLMANGEYFQTGVPKGWSDLLVITDYGEVIFCETKIHPRKPTAEQLKFISEMKSRHIRAFVAYSLEEFIKEVR